MTSDELEGITVWRAGGAEYTREDLMNMEPVRLRALFRERVHHTIEVNLYPILLGKKEVPPRFGLQTELIYDVWKSRGLPEEGDDFDWAKKNMAVAAKLRAGEEVTLDETLPTPFSQEELAVVRKLLWERRSVRNWAAGKVVPDELIEQILEAGRAAPTGCNLSPVRFVVIRDPEEAKMVWSDIPTPMDQCVLIVICYDTRIYQTVGHDQMVGHNQMLDAAAAADHMLLMAHSLGLGGVWLTCHENTAATFHKKYGLPDYIKQVLHMAIGWPVVGSIKSGRQPLSEMIISREKS